MNDRNSALSPTKTAKLSDGDLMQFTGTENWYRHGINRNFLFTDGAKYVADKGGAYWLLDTITMCQRHEPRITADVFQVWTLTVRPDRTATLTCDDGNASVVYTEKIGSRISRARRSRSGTPTV
jgi:hypothetical protein